jgi:hypothetical protein
VTSPRTMATHLNPVQWEHPSSLDPLGPLHLLEVPRGKNSSFLHSQKLRENLSESRKAFLRSIGNDEEKEATVEPNHEPRRTPAKKISFKIKKTASIYRRNPSSTPKMATINASKVAELTKKFNGMIHDKNSILEQPKFREFVKRVNSQRSLDSDKVARKTSAKSVVRKPSVKTKPANLDEKEIVIVKRKPVIKRKTNDQTCVSAKVDCVEASEQARPDTLSIGDGPQPPPKPSPVRAAIEIFERRNSESSVPNPIVPKPKVPERKPALTKIQDKTDDEPVQTPQRRCESMYETPEPKLSPPQTLKVTRSEETVVIKPNTSFLWSINQDKSPSSSKDDWRDLYDFVDPSPLVPPRVSQPPSPPKKTFKKSPPEEKIYEELNVSRDEDTVSHSYEYCEGDDGYEVCTSRKENIYETLPPPLLPRRQQLEPLPPRPPSRSSYCTIQNGENVSNCYESIYNAESKSNESTYESIYGCQIRQGGSNRDSLISSDQQSNSLYGRASLVGWGDDGGNPYSGKATSDLSTSDRSDDWVDVTDNEDNDNNNSEVIIIRERQKKKTTGWSRQFREQWSKSPRKLPTEQCEYFWSFKVLWYMRHDCFATSSYTFYDI